MLSIQDSLTKVNVTCKCQLPLTVQVMKASHLQGSTKTTYFSAFGDVVLMDDIAITLNRPTYRGRVVDTMKRCIDWSKEQRFPVTVSGHKAFVC